MLKGTRLLGIIVSFALLSIPTLAGLGSVGVGHSQAWGGLSALTSTLERHMVGHAFAEESGLRVAQMKLSVWPEYDEPRVLAIYDGELTDKTGYPKKVSFRVPKGAEVSQVCGLSDKGEHLCQLYEVKEEADYKVVTYELPVPHFFMEYYFNPVGSEALRDIAYDFSSVYPVDKLDIEVQQPLRSSDFAMTPLTTSTSSDNQGFKYSLLNYGRINADQKVDLKISYSKQDSRPSVPKKQQGAPAGGGVDTSNLNMWALLGGSALLGLMAYYVISRRPGRLIPQSAGYGGKAGGQGNYSKTVVYSRPAGRSKGGSKAQGAAQFCTGCGNPIEAGDRFCARCGKRAKGG